MTTTTERSATRLIEGVRIDCFESRDGVYRSEWVGHDAVTGDATYGAISKSRWNDCVTAETPDGRTEHWHVGRELTTAEAFAAARRWLYKSRH